MFLDELTLTPKTMTVAQLQRDITAHRLAVVSATTREPHLPTESASDPDRPELIIHTVEDLPQRHREAVDFRHRLVKQLRRAGITRGQRRAIAATLQRLIAGAAAGEPASELAVQVAERKPSVSAVMGWMRRFELSDSNPFSLVDRTVYRQQPKRLDPRAIEIAQRHIEQHYCTRQRPTLAQTKLLIERDLCAEAATGALPPSAASISTSSLRRLTHELGAFERDVARYGIAYARNRWRYSKQGLDVPGAMARYEIDHTILDIVVIHDVTGMPLGRPTITIVVDAFSGYITGLFVSFWGTGLATSLAAIKVAISPKDDLTSGLGLANPWIAYGIPLMLVVDNGLEFHSPHFHAAARHLNTDLLFCKVRQPWLKPIVERSIGSITGILPTHGRVEKPRDNYLPIAPDKTASITFGALCEGLVKSVVDVLPFEIKQRKLYRPFDRFSESLAEQLPPALPTSTRELDLIAAISKPMTVSGEGVVTQYLRYRSDELERLRRDISTKFQTTVKINPEDLSEVYVQDPRTKGWLVVPSCDPSYTTDLSLVQHKAIRQRLKGELARNNAAEKLAQAKLELLDLWSSAASRGKRLRSDALRRLSGLTSRHALETGAPSLSTQPARNTEGLLTHAPDELTFSIPTYDAYDLD